VFFNRYKHVAIDRFRGPPDPKELVAIECALACPLPTDFVEFLEVANGGSIDGYSISAPVSPQTDSLAFPGIYFVGKDRKGSYGYGTFVGEIHAERRTRSIPPRVLPFARSGGGSVVFQDLASKERPGRVVAYVHGLPGWTGRARTDQFVELAPTFAEYVARLRVDEKRARKALEQARARGDRDQIAANEEFLDIGLPGWRER
jgi:hypothetical protein